MGGGGRQENVIGQNNEEKNVGPALPERRVYIRMISNRLKPPPPINKQATTAYIPPTNNHDPTKC